LKILGQVAPLKDTSVTHGMCEQCLKKMTKEVEEMRRTG